MERYPSSLIKPYPLLPDGISNLPLPDGIPHLLLPGQVINSHNKKVNNVTLNIKNKPPRTNPITDPLLQNTQGNIQAFKQQIREFLYDCQYGELDEVKTLFGINHELINAKDTSNRTCVLYAARGGKLEVFKYLIEKGADINAIDIGGDNALHYATRFPDGNLDLVKLLVDDKGFDVNKQGNYNETALHCAVLGLNIDIISFLINKGANLYLKDINGETPYQLARSFKSIYPYKSVKDILGGIEKMLKEAMDKSPAQGGSRKSCSRRHRKRKSRTRKTRR
jgi:ankyrin repeat protein